MHAPLPALRLIATVVALAAITPAQAQYQDVPPPPPESLPWATPARPPPPQRPPAPRPVYRPDYAYGPGGWQPAPVYAPPPVYLPPPVYAAPVYAPPPVYAAPVYAPPVYAAPQASPPPPVAAPPPPPPAVAPQPWRSQFEVALRGGVAWPGGTATAGMPLADLLGEQVVLGVELGVRTAPHLYLGLLAEGGFGTAGPAYGGPSQDPWGCWGTVHCDGGSATGRIGAGVRLHLAPSSGLDPWIGYGVALSGATVNGHDAAGTFSRTLVGVEYAKLSLGADLALSPGSAIGLYAEWTSGVFTQAEDREDGVVVASGDLPGTTTHSWFTIGPRLRF